MPTQVQRVADALSGWKGRVQVQERQVPIGYIVFLPPSELTTGQTLDYLQSLGVLDVFLISTPGPLQGGVSLGMFREKERAVQQLEQLVAKGVRNLEIRERQGPQRTFYALYGTSAQMKAAREIYSLNRRGDLIGC
ncbi:MAG: hypothetical protein HC848_02315 [Limnobacter sp.]|nr:hypothetical protein [Limnobacter sp.]